MRIVLGQGARPTEDTPAMVGDSPYGHRGRAFALGYIQGLIDMMELDDMVAHVE
jgi:hypothetical protein